MTTKKKLRDENNYFRYKKSYFITSENNNFLIKTLMLLKTKYKIYSIVLIYHLKCIMTFFNKYNKLKNTTYTRTKLK